MFRNWGGYGYTRLHLTEIRERSRWKRRKGENPSPAVWEAPTKKAVEAKRCALLDPKARRIPGGSLAASPWSTDAVNHVLQINIWNYTRTFQRNPFLRLCGHSMQRLIGRYTLSISQRKFLFRALFSSSAQFLFATRHQIDWEQVYWFEIAVQAKIPAKSGKYAETSTKTCKSLEIQKL